MKDILVALLLISGSFFMFLSGLGTFRFPDVYSRMHAATKAASFGIGLLLAGFTIYYFNWFVAVQSCFIIIFIFITAPVGAHMLSRAAYRLNVRQCSQTIVDEMEGLYDDELKESEKNKDESC